MIDVNPVAVMVELDPGLPAALRPALAPPVPTVIT
jgi:hypothetical protein